MVVGDRYSNHLIVCIHILQSDLKLRTVGVSDLDP